MINESSQTDENSPNSLPPPPECYPLCRRCDKAVERLTVQPHAQNAEQVVVAYECHGKKASQTMSSESLSGKQGLAAYTAFSDFTSGLMPR